MTQVVEQIPEFEIDGFKFLAQRPWAHQLEAFKVSKDKRYYAFFFDVGAGKTYSCINTWRYNCNKHKRVLKTLIFCPPIVRENWRRELLKYSNLKESQIEVLDGNACKRQNILEKSKAKIFITNYESLLMKDLFMTMTQSKFECVILDEAHKIKDPKSQRTKKIHELTKYIEEPNLRYALSGTPVLNTMLDLWSIFKFLNDGTILMNSFYAFRNFYFYDKNAGAPSFVKFQDWRPRPGAELAIKDKIRHQSMFVKKEDCLDLPPLIKKTVYVDLTPAQQHAYDGMEKDFISVMDNNSAAVAELAITKALRLQQIVTGFVNVESGNGERVSFTFDDNPRINALCELVEEHAKYRKIIVWAVFKQNFIDIAKMLDESNITFVECHGETKDKQVSVDAFTKDPKVRVFLGHPGSGGIGINLVESDMTIFYSRNFSLENDIQASARNHRGGSERHKFVLRIDIVAKNTIDEKVLDALASKQEIGEKVLHRWKKELEDARGTKLKRK